VREALTEIMTRRALARLERRTAGFRYTSPASPLPRQRVPAHRRPRRRVPRHPSKALTLDQLNMPDSVRSLCRVNNGLILVTGKTGSGKSTTLAR